MDGEATWGPGKTFWVKPQVERRGTWGPGKTFWIEEEADA